MNTNTLNTLEACNFKPSPHGGVGGGSTPRGLRNNNPLNIRHSKDKWQGMKEVQTDKAFVQFKSLAYGFRAAFKTIRTYMTKYGCRNVTQIIMRWAPPSENNTEAYVRKVCQLSKLSPVEPLDCNNEKQMHRLVQAMAFVENGVIIEGDSIREGWRLADPHPTSTTGGSVEES